MTSGPGNHLLRGDDIDVPRARIADGTVRLVRLDRPFNLDATDGLVVRGPSGQGSGATIWAFEDTIEGEAAPVGRWRRPPPC